MGVPKHDSNINIFSLPLHFGKTIIGSHGGESKPQEAIPRYLNLFKKGICTIDDLISDRYILRNINSAINFMRSGKSVGRIMIEL